MLSLDLASNTLGHFDEFICFKIQVSGLLIGYGTVGSRNKTSSVGKLLFFLKRGRHQSTLGEDGEKGREKKEMEKEKADVKIKG